DRFLYFGSDRFNTNGDAQQGFQFLQAATCLAGAFNGQTAGGTAACPSDTPSNPTGCTPAFSNNTGNLGYFVDPTTGCPVHHTNDGLDPLTNVSVTDDKCSPLVRGTDDPGNNDATLSPGETWVFTCTQTITTANSTVTNTATGSGFDTGLNKTVTFCVMPRRPP